MNNVIDFIAYRDARLAAQTKQKSPEELGIAIQILIQRLRENNPIGTN